MKRIPYGISDYKTLIEKNYVFVDKTKYIEKLENYHSPYIFFLRPRRFGKSLFTSMLSYYFDINERDNFENLFGYTYIGKNPTEERNGYYILSFNFSSLRTETQEGLEESFYLEVKAGLDKFESNYNLQLDYVKNTFVSSMFVSFLSAVQFKIDKPIYVIIDEYDHFANELLSFKPELFKDIISKTGFVRKFYEALKIGTEKVVGRIFATGVSPITLDSMTSGFNIGDNLTRNELFHEMMGFSDLEVRNLIKITTNNKPSKEEIEDLMIILRENYNGYLFAERANTRLFNSDMILYYLKYYVETGRAPKKLIDENIASDYNKIGSLFNLTTKGSKTKIIDKILKGEELIGFIVDQFSLEKDFEEDDFLSMLFYLGFLTIDEEEFAEIKFKVPNNVIKGLYFDYFQKKLREDLEDEIDNEDIKVAVRDIVRSGDINGIVQIVEKTLNKLSNRDYFKEATSPKVEAVSSAEPNRRFGALLNEKYIKIIIIAYLNLSKAYLIKSEYEVEDGYIDIALLNNHIIKPRYYGIIELKYITKKEYEKLGEAIVNKRKDEAIVQINKYKNSEELLNYKNLKKWVLVFVCDKCVVNLELE